MSINELASFFEVVWDNPEARKHLNELDNQKTVHEDSIQFRLVEQLLQEAGYDKLLPIFKMAKFKSNDLLSVSYDNFINIFKNEVDERSLSMLYQKGQTFL